VNKSDYPAGTTITMRKGCRRPARCEWRTVLFFGGYTDYV